MLQQLADRAQRRQGPVPRSSGDSDSEDSDISDDDEDMPQADSSSGSHGASSDKKAQQAKRQVRDDFLRCL